MNILANLISLTILFAVPLLLVALGGMFSEHSGVINIALEGMMIIGALFACLTLQAFDQNGFGALHPQLAMFAAILVAGLTGMIFSVLLGFAAINLKADQTIGGTALNQFAPAFAIVMTWALQGQGLTTIFIPNWARITQQTLGLPVPENPGFWDNLLFKYFYLTTPVAIVLFIASYVLLYKTRFGLRLMACGEHPQAADSVGINVYKMRWAGVLMSGALGGIAAYKHRKAIERTLQDIADQMDAWEDDGDFFHDDDTVVHTMPSASREEASAEAPAEAEPEEQIPAQEEKSESEAPEADDSDFATPETDA